MKILLTTYQGLENLLIEQLNKLKIKDIKSISKQKIIVECTTKSLEEIKNKIRIITDINELIFYFNYKSPEDIKTQIGLYDFKDLIVDGFVVRINRNNNKEIQTTPLESQVGEILYKKYQKKVSLKSPNITIFLDITKDMCFVCLKKDSQDIKKRDYKIKTHKQDISGPLACAIIHLSGYKKGKTLIDPYANIGTLLIEASLISKDKVYAIESSYKTAKDLEINASIAKLKNKIIIYNKQSKIKNRKFDFIITQPPKSLDIRQVIKDINKLSKSTSNIILILKDFILNNENEKDYKLNIYNFHKIIVGKTIYTILICNQKKS